jgi:hypothetical protein
MVAQKLTRESIEKGAWYLGRARQWTVERVALRRNVWKDPEPYVGRTAV